MHLEKYSSPSSIAQLTQAERDAGNKLEKKIQKLVSITGGSVPWSRAERKAALPYLLAQMHRYGAPSFFVTINPSDTDSWIIMRMVNFEKWNHTPVKDIRLPVREDRSRDASANPLAVAQSYIRTMLNVFTNLLRLPENSHTRTCHPPVASRPTGVLGTTVAFGGVTELTGREVPHAHFLVWTTMSPHLIQEMVDNAAVMDMVAKHLDSIVTTTVPDSAYLPDVGSSRPSTLPHEKYPERMQAATQAAAQDGRELRTDRYPEVLQQRRDMRNECPLPPSPEFKVCAESTHAVCNRHRHTLTCRSERRPDVCRFNYPRGRQDATCILHIYEISHDPHTGKPRVLARYVDSNAPKPKPANANPMHVWDDPRPLLLEMMRTVLGEPLSEEWVDELLSKPHSMMAAGSLAFSEAMRCNNNVEPTGLLGQAVGAMFYIVKYITKEGYKPIQSVPLLRAVQDHVARYPSKADDSGTKTRIDQHTLTRLVNSTNGTQEIPATLAALCLCNFPSNFFSDSFVFLHIADAVSFVRREKTKLAAANSAPSDMVRIAVVVVASPKIRSGMGGMLQVATSPANAADAAVTAASNFDDMDMDADQAQIQSATAPAPSVAPALQPQNPTDLWRGEGACQLTMKERDLLLGCERLNDLHVCMAHKLLLPLLQERVNAMNAMNPGYAVGIPQDMLRQAGAAYKYQPNFTIQIHFLQTNHPARSLGRQYQLWPRHG